MRAAKICLFLFAFINSIHTQNVGEWKIYSDMKKINSAVISGAGIWAATDGAAFNFNFADSSFTTVTKANGLNSQALSSAAIDNYNRIWFGSKEGYINVFDPADNSVSKILDIYQSNKSLRQINDISVKGDSVLVAYDFGLSILNAKSLSFTDSFLKLGSFPAESKVLCAFKSSIIFVVTEYGIAVQKSGSTNLSAPESWNNYSFSFLPFASGQTASKFVQFNGQVLLGTSNGIYSFSNNSWQLFAFAGKNILDMKVYGTKLYAVTSSEVLTYSAGQTSTFYTSTSVPFTEINVASDGTLYLSTANGLMELKNSRTRFIYPNGPAGNLFVNMSVDPAGNLWIATGKNSTGKGIFKFDGTNWKSYNRITNPILDNDDYYNVYAAPDSTVYFCNWGSGLAIMKNEKIETINAKNSTLVGVPQNISFIAVPDCKTDSKGNLWILNTQSASRKPLSMMSKDKTWTHFSFSNPVLTENDNVDKLVIDQNDTKWFTVWLQGNIGLYYFNENKTPTITSDDTQGYLSTANNLLTNVITALAVDQRGYLWIGTSVGVNVILDPLKPKVTSTLGAALRNQTINCIAIDPLDQKWIGTQQGVFVLSSDGIQLVSQFNTKNSPLPNDVIKSITFDAKNGIAYIGTDYGLASLQTASIQSPQSFEEISVYPNPFIIGEDDTSLTIDGLIKNTSVRIFTIAGELIQDFKSPGGRVAFWDGKDLTGKYVPTGIYLIFAYDEGANNVKTSKVAVIKK